MIAPVLRFFMRVCMEPRLLPGVRCSVLKTVKSWPSCRMTMPGRSNVALTLLICSLEGAISKIQAGQACGRIRNDSRHAGVLHVASANSQYKGPASTRSIVALLFLLCALGGGHVSFDFVGIAGEALAEQLVTGSCDENIVFDANTEIFFGNVDSGFDRHDHPGLQRAAIFARVVHIEPDVMSQAVNEIGTERFALTIFSVRVDVVVGNICQPVFFAFTKKIGARLDGRKRGILRA